MKTTISDIPPRLIHTAYTVEDLQCIEAIRESCFPAEFLLQNHPLASRVVDGMMQLMQAFPDADYNSEEGRWQIYNLVWWLLCPERTKSLINKLHKTPTPTA